MSAPSDGILASSEDGTLLIVLSRPAKVNALGKAHLAELAGTIRDAREASAVIVTGDGGNFSSGFDLDEITRGPSDDEIDDLLADLERAIEGAPVPVLAAVEGACVGAGCDVALMCDLIVAGASSFFSLPSVRMGVVYRTPAVREIVRRAGPQAAALLLLFGERMPAEAARECGLVGAVVPDGAALKRARELASSAARGVPEAAIATKRLLRALRNGEVEGPPTLSGEETRRR